METIDYTTRKDLVDALVDARSRGVEVQVVGNGLTLQFLDGIGATPEDEAVEELEVPVEPVVEPATEICETCEREYPAPLASNHTEEECLANLASDADEDLIGATASPTPAKRKRNKS